MKKIEDIKAVANPIKQPIAKEPINIPIKMPIDLNSAAASNTPSPSPEYGEYVRIELYE